MEKLIFFQANFIMHGNKVSLESLLKKKVSPIVSQTTDCHYSVKSVVLHQTLSVWRGGVVYRRENMGLELTACISQARPLLAPGSCE